MKKFVSILLAIILMLGGLTACGNQEPTAKKETSVEETKEAAKESEKENTKETGKEKNIQIVTTIFPEYDWVKKVLGDNPANADVTLLLDNGVDLHSYQPTAEDILKISNADLFIYVGGESDAWVDDALADASNKNMQVINLMDVLNDSIKEEEVVEGMQDEEHDHEETEHSQDKAKHEEEVEYDEHVWLSLKNTQKLVQAIDQALEKIDSKNKDVYSANTKAYLEKLATLDQKYQEVVDQGKRKTVLFGDRFPFRYLVDDYGLKYYAAFVGCSAESEASFETISFLAKKVDELNLPCVLTIEGKNHKIAETIVQNTKDKDQKILTMDSMQASTSKDLENGRDYLSIMEENLKVLKEALN